MKKSKGQQMGFRRIDHTADVGIVIFGPTQKALFEAAAKALFTLLVDGDSSGPGKTENLEIEGEDRADLLVNFLRELLYLWSGNGLLVREAKVTAIHAKRLSAIVKVYPFEPRHHVVQNDIKAVTYHQSSVKKGPAGWEAKIIFDV